MGCLELLPPIKSLSAMTEQDRIEHMRVNSAKVAARLPEMVEPHGSTAILCCYGPSLQKTWETAVTSIGDLITVSAAHAFLVEREWHPQIHIDCDPRAHKAQQMGQPTDLTEYWLASCVHPSYLEKLRDYRVTLWHLHNGPETETAFFNDPVFKPGEWLCVGGGSVGLRSISLLYSQGYRHFEIHGMDCSYDGEAEFAGAHLGKARNRTSVKCGDRWFESNFSLIDYARQFLDDLRLWPGATFRVHGDGLLAHMIHTREKINE